MVPYGNSSGGPLPASIQRPTGSEESYSDPASNTTISESNTRQAMAHHRQAMGAPNNSEYMRASYGEAFLNEYVAGWDEPLEAVPGGITAGLTGVIDTSAKGAEHGNGAIQDEDAKDISSPRKPSPKRRRTVSKSSGSSRVKDMGGESSQASYEANDAHHHSYSTKSRAITISSDDPQAINISQPTPQSNSQTDEAEGEEEQRREEAQDAQPPKKRKLNSPAAGVNFQVKPWDTYEQLVALQIRRDHGSKPGRTQCDFFNNATRNTTRPDGTVRLPRSYQSFRQRVSNLTRQGVTEDDLQVQLDRV